MELLPLSRQRTLLLDHLREPRFAVGRSVAATARKVDPVVKSAPPRGQRPLRVFELPELSTSGTFVSHLNIISPRADVRVSRKLHDRLPYPRKLRLQLGRAYQIGVVDISPELPLAKP